jgi:hypothetical protein
MPSRLVLRCDFGGEPPGPLTQLVPARQIREVGK